MGWLVAEEHLTRAALAVKRVEKGVGGKVREKGVRYVFSRIVFETGVESHKGPARL
jgi:hypothetical protein